MRGTAPPGDADEVARRVQAAEHEDAAIVPDNGGLNKIDPSTFATNGGPSIAETMARKANIWWTRADNRRVAGIGASAGWDQVRARLKGEEDDGSVPMIYFMDCCVHAIRTLPTLPRDPNKLDDIDTDTKDHAADAIRYGCMARIYEPPIHDPRHATRANPLVRSMDEFSLEDAWASQVSQTNEYVARN
jgi:hypothetical protein